MDNYTRQSYEPDNLYLSTSGSIGTNGEPLSLVEESDQLTQNILLLAYHKPVSTMELAKALGVPAAYIEPIIQKLIHGELMQQTSGRNVYTDFIIFTEQNRKATFDQQLQIADTHFESFWNHCGQALAELRQKDYYMRQNTRAKNRLELHFCIRLLSNAILRIRDEKAGNTSFSNYPYRKDGGRWFALGNHYTLENSYKKDDTFQNYTISGEASVYLKRFQDAQSLELHSYDTWLGHFPYSCFQAEYIRWFYEILKGIPAEQSTVQDYVLESADKLIQAGILLMADRLRLDIPVLNRKEYNEESRLAASYEDPVIKDVKKWLLPLLSKGCVKLPAHLNNIPGWMSYMFCIASIPMAVINQAIERGCFLTDTDYKVPATLLVYESDTI